MKKPRERIILDDKKCPDCGSDVIDYRIKEGKYTGHGKIWCDKCDKLLIII